MTFFTYVSALVRAAIVVTALVVASTRLVARFARSLSGARAALAASVVALSVLLVTAQLLGIVGWLSYWPIAGTTVAVAIACHVAWPRPHRSSTHDSRRPVGAIAVLAVALTVGVWTAGVANSYRNGITEADSLRYHLPMAATFAQRHSITELKYFELDRLATTAPNNNELLNAVAMTTSGNDVFVPLLSALAAALALLAGWCIGARWGRPDLALLAVAVTLVVPITAAGAPGTAKVDTTVVALLAAAIALLPSRDRPAELWLVGLAAGLAVAVKLTAIAPVVVLAAGAAIAFRRAWRPLLVAGLCAAVTGSYWYVRNIARTGSVVPSADLSIGPFAISSAPDPVLQLEGFAIVDRWTERSFLHSVPDGLSQAFGPGWPLVLALAAVGMIAAIASKRRRLQLIGAVSVAVGLVYLVTPYSAGGLPDAWLFPADIRFVVPAVSLGLVLVVLVPASGRTVKWLTGGLLVALVSPLVAKAPWISVPVHYRVLAAVTAVALGLAWSGLRAVGHRSTRLAVASVAALSVGLVVLGYEVQRDYVARRYLAAAATDHPKIDAWAQSVTHTRIAISGVSKSYPFYGRDGSNTVDYLGVVHRDGAFTSYPDCAAFVSALDAGNYQFLVVGDFKSGLETAPERWWALSDPRAEPLLTDGSVVVFSVSAASSSGSCAGPQATVEPLVGHQVARGAGVHPGGR